MLKVRTRRIIQGSDYSAQEPRCLSALCRDEGMLAAYRIGKDLYCEIASIALHVPYKFCLEHFPKGCPIKKNDDGKWVYAKLKNGEDDDITNFEDFSRYLADDFNADDYDYDKLADGETDVFKEGKERRNQAKRILLGIMYGRGKASIAEQLGCEVEEAEEIKNNVYAAFPRIKVFEEESNKMVREHGYVTTLWGRKRRLPDYNLPQYEYVYVDNNGNVLQNMKVPQTIQDRYNSKLSYAKWKEKDAIIERAKKEDQILIIDNQSKKAQAGRQIINSRVQGSSADMSKLACIKIYNDEELTKRGVKIIIPVHDEILIETPLRYAKFVKKQFAYDMIEAPQPKLGIPMSCDVVSANGWYHDELELDDILGDLEDI